MCGVEARMKVRTRLGTTVIKESDEETAKENVIKWLVQLQLYIYNTSWKSLLLITIEGFKYSLKLSYINSHTLSYQQPAKAAPEKNGKNAEKPKIKNSIKFNYLS